MTIYNIKQIVSDIKGINEVLNSQMSPNTVQLGIQAPAGTQFFLNGTKDAIEIGHTQIFELDLKDSNTYITNLYFPIQDGATTAENENDNKIIVNILYEEEV